MGRILDKLFTANDIGKLRGVAQPSYGHYIHNPSEGFVGEAVGLTSAGYGQITLKGEDAKWTASILWQAGIQRIEG